MLNLIVVFRLYPRLSLILSSFILIFFIGLVDALLSKLPFSVQPIKFHKNMHVLALQWNIYLVYRVVSAT